MSPDYTSLSPAYPASLDEPVKILLVLAAFFSTCHRHSHDGAAFGLVLAEGGGEEICLAGQVEESLGEASDRAGFGGRLKLVHAGQGCHTEHAVDALLRCEG